MRMFAGTSLFAGLHSLCFTMRAFGAKETIYIQYVEMQLGNYYTQLCILSILDKDELYFQSLSKLRVAFWIQIVFCKQLQSLTQQLGINLSW